MSKRNAPLSEEIDELLSSLSSSEEAANVAQMMARLSHPLDADSVEVLRRYMGRAVLWNGHTRGGGLALW